MEAQVGDSMGRDSSWKLNAKKFDVEEHKVESNVQLNAKELKRAQCKKFNVELKLEELKGWPESQLELANSGRKERHKASLSQT